MKKTLLVAALIAVPTAAGFASLAIHQKTMDLESIDNALSEAPLTKDWRGLCSYDPNRTLHQLEHEVRQDPTLAAYYQGFDFAHAQPVTVSAGQLTHRLGQSIQWTKKTISLPSGDRQYTDGRRIVRAQCCNEVLPPPRPAVPPAQAAPPAMVAPPAPPAPVIDLPPDRPTVPENPYSPEIYQPLPLTFLTNYFDPRRLYELRTYGQAPAENETLTATTVPPVIISAPLPINAPAPVPEPSTILTACAGLLMLAGLGRKR